MSYSGALLRLTGMLALAATGLLLDLVTGDFARARILLKPIYGKLCMSSFILSLRTTYPYNLLPNGDEVRTSINFSSRLSLTRVLR